MELVANIRPIESLGYQIIFDDMKRIVSINLLYNNKILVKNRLSKPIMAIDNTIINDLVNTTLLGYMNNRSNCNSNKEKSNKSKADFYANIMSIKKE